MIYKRIIITEHYLTDYAGVGDYTFTLELIENII